MRTRDEAMADKGRIAASGSTTDEGLSAVRFGIVNGCGVVRNSSTRTVSVDEDDEEEKLQRRITVSKLRPGTRNNILVDEEEHSDSQKPAMGVCVRAGGASVRDDSSGTS